MYVIAHRRNTIGDLRSTAYSYGVEIDIRSNGDDLILQHDPFASGDSLDEWLTHYRHSILILNVKEEGLEDSLIKKMDEFGISNYFFLDQTFPFLVRTAQKGESRCAVRVSEYESVASALSLAGAVKWVWVDCFTHFPLSLDEVNQLRAAGFKLCGVSPELQGRNSSQEILEFQDLLSRKKIVLDAICTKHPELW